MARAKTSPKLHARSRRAPRFIRQTKAARPSAALISSVVKVKRESRDSSLEPDPDNNIYEVEVILAARPLRGTGNTKHEFLTQWYGYPGEDTWEPIESFLTCQNLMESFWKEVGGFNTLNRKMVRPSQEWIDSEIEYFRKTYKKPELAHSQPVTTIGKDGKVTHFEN